MAKRIINYGKFNKADCPICECKFAFEDGDCEKSEGEVIVQCPLCKAHMKSSTDGNVTWNEYTPPVVEET